MRWQIRSQQNCITFMKGLLGKGYSDAYVESKAYQSFGAKVGLSFISSTIPRVKREIISLQEKENGKS